MRKVILYLFFLLSCFSGKSQEYIDADTVKMTLIDTSDFNLGYDYQTCLTSSSFPFYENDEIIGHLSFQYSYFMNIPIFTINIEDDGGDLYKKLSLTIDSIQNDQEIITRAMKTNKHVDVPEFDIVLLFPSGLYKLSPSMLKNNYIYKVWDNEKENYSISVNITCSAFVELDNSAIKLSEKMLLKDDIYCVYIKYGNKIIQISLLPISTSKLSARFKQLLKNKNEKNYICAYNDVLYF